MSSPLNFQLEQYEGPLDLLLDLIRRNQINIYDIPIAQITSQYMEYVGQAVALDIELSSEFIYMASTLIHIKSKLLLPKDPELEKLDLEEDPRKELVDRLIEHEKYKNAAEMLQQKRLLEEAAWSNPQIRQFLAEEQNPGLDVTLFDLVKTFQSVLERAKNRPSYDVSEDEVSVPEMIRYVRGILTDANPDQSLSVTRLFEDQASKRAILCLFLAILELVKAQAIQLVQMEAFSDILIKRHTGFDQAFAVEQEYQ